MIGDPNAPFTNTLPDITENTDVLDSEMNSRYKILLDNDSRLNALLAQHTTQISALQGQVLTLQQNLSTAQGQIATLQAQVAELMEADTTPPTISLAAEDTTINAAGSMTLTATASDDTAITKVEFYRNGVKIGEDSSSPYTLVEDYAFSDNGTHTYYAKAIDSSNNQTDSGVVTVTVSIPPADSTGPTISYFSIDKVNLAGAQDELRMHAVATDPSGIEKVEFYRNGVLDGTVSTFPYRHSRQYTTADGTGGDIWTAKAYDNFGNSTTTPSEGQSVYHQMGVSGAAPVISGFVTVNNGLAESIDQYGDIPLSVDVTDAEAVTFVNFFYKKNQTGYWQQIAGSSAPTAGSTYTTEKTIAAGGSGVYEFFAQAEDADGNKTNSPVSRRLVLIPDDAGRAIYQGTKTNAVAAAPGAYKPVTLLESSVTIPAGKKLYITGDRALSYTPDPAYLGPAEIEVAYMDYDPSGDMIVSRVTLLNHNTSANTTSQASGTTDILICHNTSGSDLHFNLYINLKNTQSAGGTSVKGGVTYDLQLKLTS